MKLRTLVALFLSLVAFGQEAPRKIDDPAIGRKVEDFEFRDVHGRRGSLKELLRGSKAVVIALTAADCPVSKLYRPKLERLETELAKRGVAVAILERPPKALPATRTTDAFVIDAKGLLRYRGAVDDQYGIGYRRDAPRETYLLDAVDAVLAGKVVAIPATEASGCPFETPKGVTYHRDVEPILQRSCAECHRPDEVGPFPLLTFDDARKHMNKLRRAVEERRMPPWHANPDHGSWKNDRRLTADEIATISKWAEEGGAEGDPKDAPRPKDFTKGWRIGTPDLVVQMPRPVKVDAEGTMPYKYVFVSTKLKEDRWVEAIEVRAGARQVVHHILIFLQEGVEETRGGLESYFGIMVPGEEPTVFPEGYGKKLKAGSRFIFQVHYTPIGEAMEDQSSVGIRFAKKPVEREVITQGIYNENIEIPPNAADHTETASFTFDSDAEIHSLLPHMHLRGKAFRYELVTPDQKREILLDVPKYDFNWQMQYRFREPKLVTKGSKIIATAVFDNSKGNPANPDPTKTVRFGQQTEEEMLIGYMDYVRR